jgi:hypothetical protein
VINFKAIPKTNAYVTLSAADGGVLPCGLGCVAFPSVHTDLTCVLAFSFLCPHTFSMIVLSVLSPLQPQAL